MQEVGAGDKDGNGKMEAIEQLAMSAADPDAAANKRQRQVSKDDGDCSKQQLKGDATANN